MTIEREVLRHEKVPLKNIVIGKRFLKNLIKHLILIHDVICRNKMTIFSFSEILVNVLHELWVRDSQLVVVNNLLLDLFGNGRSV